MRVAVLALVLASYAAPQVVRQPPRDRRTVVSGRAALAGVVIEDDERSAPLRRAKVTLNSPELPVGRTVITNDNGTFTFDHLPAGRYTVGATKDAYLQVYFGARRVERIGHPIVLADGETRSIMLRVPRGAVIAGTITDGEGQPAPGISVEAYVVPTSRASGERLFPATIQAATDDLGGYRLYGLAAGEYVVVARPPLPLGEMGTQIVSSAELRRALADSRQPPARSRPGFGYEQRVTGAPARPEPRRTVDSPPVFYPGTLFPSQARTIALRVGEVRTGVDFATDVAETATVSGNVFTPAGFSPPRSVLLVPSDDLGAVSGVRSARPDPSGNFVFVGVSAGQYRVAAYGLRIGGAGVLSSAVAPESWASSDIAVDGEDVDNLQLTMRPAVRISGQVVFEGNLGPPAPKTFTTSLPATAASGITGVIQPLLAVDAEWRFELTAIPARYRLSSAIQGQRTALAGWWLKSIVVSGRELLDSEIEFRDGAENATVTLSDHASEVTGVVTSPRAQELSDYKVVVFGATKASWFFNSRRIAAATPDAAGRYSIRNLPPGEYFVVLTDDVGYNEWFDPAWLSDAARAATRLTIVGNETKRLDLVIK
jgi:carboxypeptidase family protein